MTQSLPLVQYASALPMRATSSDLFARVVTNVQVATPPNANPTPRTLRLTLDQIDQEIVEMDQAQRSRFRFQNLPVLQAERRAELIRAGALYEATLAGIPYLIDMSFLTMTQSGSDFPAFGILSLDSPVCSLTCIRNSRFRPVETRFQPNIPEDLKNNFLATFNKLQSQFKYDEVGEIGISAEFAGQMPLDLEKYIRICLASGFFESIWIVFEAPEWQVNKKVQVMKDPLVIGRRLSSRYAAAGPLYFLLGMFDISPWEAVVAYNFATKF